MSTGRTYRNQQIRNAIADPQANTQVRGVLGEAIDNTGYYNFLDNAGRNLAPGSASTQITLRSPTQAETVAAGAVANQPRTLSAMDRVKFGDKDFRSAAAERKLQVANELAGGGQTRDDMVDMLNQPGMQTHEAVLNAYNNDSDLNILSEMNDDGWFANQRPEILPENFVGEGQFGRVTELAPGYVSKNQAPLVEWGGYTEPGSPIGNLIGKIHDYRDVAAEVDQMNYLSKGGITPGVENFIVNDDGSTEVIMKDLRKNFQDGAEYYDSSNERQKRMIDMRSKQQEAQAALKGIELRDRHMGNVMVNKMTGRPLQIDPSGVNVSGTQRDDALANAVFSGMNAAGLTDEADIFAGIMNDLYDKGDMDGFHNMAQQGVSRLMKLKDVADSGSNYQKLL